MCNQYKKIGKFWKEKFVRRKTKDLKSKCVVSFHFYFILRTNK